MERKLTILEQIQNSTSAKRFNEDWEILSKMDKKGQTRLLNRYLRNVKKVKTQYFELIPD